MANDRELDRRVFMKGAISAALAAAAGSLANAAFTARPGAGIAQVALPYARNALEPGISERTVALHYDNHHKGYVDGAILRIKAGGFDYSSFDEAIKDLSQGSKQSQQNLLQLCVLSWNHNFYWQSLRPAGGGRPKGAMHKAVTDSFGSYEKFVEAFKTEGMRIGVGWVWVVADKGALSVLRTDYFETPLLMDKKPLLTVDVWEHAYYLDYQNRREEYLDACLKSLLDWDSAEKRYAA